MPTDCTNTVSADGKYIIQKIVGEINAEIALKYNLEAHALGRELGIRRYLSDLTECRNTDTVFDNYDFAHHDMPITPGIDRFARVAVLVDPDDHSHDFVETVAQNAGLDVTLFYSRAAAIQHLTRE